MLVLFNEEGYVESPGRRVLRTVEPQNVGLLRGRYVLIEDKIMMLELNPGGNPELVDISDEVDEYNNHFHIRVLEVMTYPSVPHLIRSMCEREALLRLTPRLQEARHYISKYRLIVTKDSRIEVDSKKLINGAWTELCDVRQVCMPISSFLIALHWNGSITTLSRGTMNKEFVDKRHFPEPVVGSKVVYCAMIRGKLILLTEIGEVYISQQRCPTDNSLLWSHPDQARPDEALSDDSLYVRYGTLLVVVSHHQGHEYRVSEGVGVDWIGGDRLDGCVMVKNGRS